MEKHKSEYGSVEIGPLESIFKRQLELINNVASKPNATVALTGGSTPKAFYKWCTETGALSQSIKEAVIWSVSDERYVPIDHEDSNFGTAKRLMLDPCNVREAQCVPWPVHMKPKDGATAFEKQWNEVTDSKAFDLCFLGMGDDCHTASLFPDSPLIDFEYEPAFAAVEVPEKGWRLTLTPSGLCQSKQVVIAVCGSNKAEAIKAVFHGAYNPKEKPIQLMKRMPEQVIWLMDSEAATQLKLDKL